MAKVNIVSPNLISNSAPFVEAEVLASSVLSKGAMAVGMTSMRSVGGAVGAVANAGVDSYSLYQNLERNDEFGARGVKEDTAKVAGKVVVGAGSVWAMATAGAFVGTAIPIPVVGTAVGFVAGAAAGVVVAYIGNEAVDGIVEGTSNYLSGETSEQALIRTEKAKYMSQWGGADGESGLEGAFRQSMDDILKLQNDIAQTNKFIQEHPEQAAKYNAQLAQCRSDLNSRTLELIGEGGIYSDYQKFIKDAESLEFISVDESATAIENMDKAFSQFTHKSIALGSNPYMDATFKTTAQNQAIVIDGTQGNGKLDRKEVENMQQILKDAGFQAGHFGKNGDGVDGILGRVTKSKINAISGNDGVLDDQDLNSLLQNAHVTKAANGNYTLANGVQIPRDEFEGMLSDVALALNGNGTNAPSQTQRSSNREIA